MLSLRIHLLKEEWDPFKRSEFRVLVIASGGELVSLAGNLSCRADRVLAAVALFLLQEIEVTLGQ